MDAPESPCLDEKPAGCRLADIRDGRIEVVVVDKIDRLTRSPIDFSRVVDAFDRHEVPSPSRISRRIHRQCRVAGNRRGAFIACKNTNF